MNQLARNLLAPCLFASLSLTPPSAVAAPPDNEWDLLVDLDESLDSNWNDVLAKLAADGATLHRPGDVLAESELDEMIAKAEALFGEVEDPRGFVYADYPPGIDLGGKIAELKQMKGVEDCSGAVGIEVAGDLPPNPAPNLAPQQTYLFGAHVGHIPTGAGSLGGHNLPALSQFGSGGATVRTAILEFGAQLPPWGALHEDLQSANVTVVFPNPTGIQEDYVSVVTPTEVDHGTATLGIHAADQDNPFNPQVGPGITGATPNAQILFVPIRSAQSGSHLAAAILAASALLQPRDVLTMSLQTTSLLPVSLDPAVRSAIQLAVASGITVTEAAGNGSFDLDAVGLPNDGAIWVGALNPITGARETFSNFGSQVRVCAQGSLVATLGYGDASPGAQSYERYTTLYNGTSSATAILSALIAAGVDAWNTTFAAGVPPAVAPAGFPAGWPLNPTNVLEAVTEFAPAGIAGWQRIGVFPDAQSFSRRLGVAPYGAGSVSSCAGCSAVPVLEGFFACTPVGSSPWTDWTEPQIGGAPFLFRVKNIPLFPNYFTALAISGAPTPGLSIPGLPGPLYVNPAALILTTPVVPHNLGPPCVCSTPNTCGVAQFQFQIPFIPTLAGFPLFLQSYSFDTVGQGYLALSNGMKVVLQL